MFRSVCIMLWHVKMFLEIHAMWQINKKHVWHGACHVTLQYMKTECCYALSLEENTLNCLWQIVLEMKSSVNLKKVCTSGNQGQRILTITNFINHCKKHLWLESRCACVRVRVADLLNVYQALVCFVYNSDLLSDIHVMCFIASPFKASRDPFLLGDIFVSLHIALSLLKPTYFLCFFTLVCLNHSSKLFLLVYSEEQNSPKKDFLDEFCLWNPNNHFCACTHVHIHLICFFFQFFLAFFSFYCLLGFFDWFVCLHRNKRAQSLIYFTFSPKCNAFWHMRVWV